MTKQPNLGNVTAMILAGGLGTRLRPAVADRPKSLAQVSGRPFIYYVLDLLCDASIGEIVFLTGYKADQVKQTVGRRYRGTAVRYSTEVRPLGTAGAARAALDLISTGRILLLNGDSYCPLDLPELASFHQTYQVDASIALSWCEETHRFGRVTWNAQRRITAFREKQRDAEPGWINAGIYLLERTLLASIAVGQTLSLEKDIFPQWIPSKRMTAYTTGAPLIDIGTPESYRLAQSVFKNLKASNDVLQNSTTVGTEN